MFAHSRPRRAFNVFLPCCCEIRCFRRRRPGKVHRTSARADRRPATRDNSFIGDSGRSFPARTGRSRKSKNAAEIRANSRMLYTIGAGKLQSPSFPTSHLPALWGRKRGVLQVARRQSAGGRPPLRFNSNLQPARGTGFRRAPARARQNEKPGTSCEAPGSG